MTLGQRLREAREANGMSIGDVARRTYIQAKFIQAIEDDNLDGVPESHRRLFVREFAKSVGVMPDALLESLPQYEPPPPQAPPELVTDARRGLWNRPPTPQLSEGERKTYSDFLKRLSRGGGMKLGTSKLPAWLIGGAGVLLLGLVVYYLFFSGGGSNASEATNGADTSGSQTQILSRGAEGETAETDAVPVDGDSLTLEGRATAKIWFAIVMDGKRSETGTMDSGSVKVWRATETFKLSLGNAGGLQLSLNEKKIGTLGPMRTSIRNQIIDANGVKKVLPTRPGATPATPVPPDRRPVPVRTQVPERKPQVTKPQERRTQERKPKPRKPASGGARLLTPTEVRTSQPPPR